MTQAADWNDTTPNAAPRKFRHRLYHRIFLSMLGFVVLALTLAALAGHLLLQEVAAQRWGAFFVQKTTSVANGLPAADRPRAELQAAVERLAREEKVDVAVWSLQGERLAFTNASLPRPELDGPRSQVLPAFGGPAQALRPDDNRWVVVQLRRVPRPAAFLFSVALLAVILALAAIPVARTLTRRVETIEAGVRCLGEGDLDSRVPVQGKDELASLAASINLTAERLQNLVEAQRRVLASASHELRSPLARLRLALELSRDDLATARPRLDEAVAEVAELNALVEELLLAGRLDVQQGLPAAAPVDLAALLAEEAGRVGATTAGGPVTVDGDERLLRVLVRNLLDNARRHAGGAVEAGTELHPDGATLWVADRGRGIPDDERERIFEPFYRPTGHAEGRDGGVGLGLYLVRRIAERHGGAAACYPREGGGTVFEVILGPPPVTP